MGVLRRDPKSFETLVPLWSGRLLDQQIFSPDDAVHILLTQHPHGMNDWVALLLRHFCYLLQSKALREHLSKEPLTESQIRRLVCCHLSAQESRLLVDFLLEYPTNACEFLAILVCKSPDLLEVATVQSAFAERPLDEPQIRRVLAYLKECSAEAPLLTFLAAPQ